MANKKRKRSKQGWFSKVTNIGIITLGMSRILAIIFNNLGNPSVIPERIVQGATFGLSKGSFDKQQGALFYGPPIAAATTKMVLSYLKRHNPVNG